MLDKHGILESLRLPQPVPPLSIPCNRHNFSTQIFWDSDIGKWIEAASYALSFRPDETVQAQIEAIIDDLEAAQAPNGYLNCWYLGREPGNRWTNLRDNHELYCAGHLLEGAVAFYQATGRDRFLGIMERYLDHIRDMFGPGPEKRRGYPGHQEIELALIRLYNATGKREHLDLAQYFIDARGHQPHYFDDEACARGEDPGDFWAKTYEYNQSHMPVREQTKVVGHAVRAMYMYAAMADLAAETGDEGLRKACETLWDDITSRRMYVTGGFGPSASNEGFTRDYDLPNDTAYAETCASVAMVFWASRMLNLNLDGRFADVLERALFNNVLAGLSQDGDSYFYDNVLESDGSHQRWKWHPCPCCTMNVSRLVASVGGYFYSVSKDTIALHLYGGASVSTEISGTRIHIEEASNYPYDGDIRATVTAEAPATFTVALRVPGWATNFSIAINGAPVEVDVNRGYAHISRQWNPGDVVEFSAPIEPARVYPHPEIRQGQGRVALSRGPLIYCFEQHDNAAPISHLRLPASTDIETSSADDAPGIPTLDVRAQVVRTDDWGDSLYRPAPPATTPVKATAVPYFYWNNRGPGKMAVWVME